MLAEITPGYYDTPAGVIVKVVKVDENGVWGCSRHYIEKEAKPDWDIHGVYRGVGIPRETFNLVAPRPASTIRPSFRSDPDAKTFSWDNLTEKKSQGRHIKNKA